VSSGSEFSDIETAQRAISMSTFSGSGNAGRVVPRGMTFRLRRGPAVANPNEHPTDNAVDSLAVDFL
jgi:hypothetical protein